MKARTFSLPAVVGLVACLALVVLVVLPACARSSAQAEEEPPPGDAPASAESEYDAPPADAPAPSPAEIGREVRFAEAPTAVPEPPLPGVPIRGVRIGRGVDDTGRVPDAQRNAILQWSDEVFIEVAGVPGDRAVALEIVSLESGQPVWSQGRSPDPGTDFVTFSLGAGTLDPGSYRARVYLNGQRFTEQAFEISGGNA